jgi:hypothetical protein
MKKHVLILALALVVALIAGLSLVWYTRSGPPHPSPPPLYCALPQHQFAEYGCTMNQRMPVYHPQPEAPGVFVPLYPGSSICRAYYVDGLVGGTLAFCPE